MARSAANSPARPVCASLIKRFQLVSPYEHQSPETNIQLERRRASPSAAGRPVPSIRARKTARRLSRSKKPFGVGVHLSAWLDGIHFHAGTALNVPTAAARTGRGLCLPLSSQPVRDGHQPERTRFYQRKDGPSRSISCWLMTADSARRMRGLFRHVPASHWVIFGWQHWVSILDVGKCLGTRQNVTGIELILVSS